MKNTDDQIKYCFDTSAFIDSWRRYYSPKIIEDLWEQLGMLMDSGEILVPREVMNELKVNKDDLWAWFKKHESCVKTYTATEILIVKTLVNKYKKLSYIDSTKPFHADPFVVAFGKTKNLTVVTWERGANGSTTKPKIGDLCNELGVKFIDVHTFIQEKGWKFKA